MFNLGDVLQLIVDCLYDSPFPEQYPVGNAHECALHVALQFGYQLYPVNKQSLKEFPADIPLVPDKFPDYP